MADLFQFEPHDLVSKSERSFSGCPYGDTTTRVSVLSENVNHVKRKPIAGV